jgi:hypothetical protein
MDSALDNLRLWKENRISDQDYIIEPEERRVYTLEIFEEKLSSVHEADRKAVKCSHTKIVLQIIHFLDPVVRVSFVDPK